MPASDIIVNTTYTNSQYPVFTEEVPNGNVFADKTYENFLRDMRLLLEDGERFKELYCEINHITSYEHVLAEEPGEASYINLFKSKSSLEER